MSIDRWIPVWDARSAHALVVNAPPERVFPALRHADFRRNPVVRGLMALRLLPALILSPRRVRAPRADAFVLLEERPPTELVFGITGRFWTLTGGIEPSDPATFTDPPPSGAAQAAWSFELEPLPDGRTRLRTETRVHCPDPAARRRFLRYWRFIRPGSGIIRRALLGQVKRQAEAHPA